MADFNHVLQGYLAEPNMCSTCHGPDSVVCCSESMVLCQKPAVRRFSGAGQLQREHARATPCIYLQQHQGDVAFGSETEPGAVANTFAFGEDTRMHEDFTGSMNSDTSRLCLSMSQPCSRNVSFNEPANVAMKRNSLPFDGGDIWSEVPQPKEGIGSSSLKLTGMSSAPPNCEAGLLAEIAEASAETPGSYNSEVQSLRVCDAWHGVGARAHTSVFSLMADDGNAKKSGSTIDERNRSTVSAGAVMTDQKCFLMSHPDSASVALCEMIGGLFGIYDLIMLPIQVGFSTANNDSIKLASATFWSFQLLRSFCIGFHSDGIVDMRFANVACAYLKTWFLVDLILVTFDWVGILLLKHSAGSSAGVLRFIRSIRLVRAFKVARAFAVMQIWGRSAYSRLLSGFISMFLRLFLVIHYMTCIQYYVWSSGNADISDQGWSTEKEEIESSEKVMHEEYLQRITWTLAMFGFGASPFTPKRTREMLVSIMANVIGMIVMPLVVGLVVDLFQQLHKATVCFSHGEELLRRFCYERRVSVNLYNAMLNLLRMRQKTMYRLDEEELEILKELPNALRKELAVELYLPVLVWHPVFSRVHMHYNACVVKIANSITQNSRIAFGQEVFMEGTKSNSMLFLTMGSFGYLTRGAREDLVKAESWVCEAALWVYWQHQGRLVAKTSAEALMINVSEFHELLRGRPHEWSVLSFYAKSFAENINAGSLEMSDLGSSHDIGLLSFMAETAVVEQDKPDFKRSRRTFNLNNKVQEAAYEGIAWVAKRLSPVSSRSWSFSSSQSLGSQILGFWSQTTTER